MKDLTININLRPNIDDPELAKKLMAEGDLQQGEINNVGRSDTFLNVTINFSDDVNISNKIHNIYKFLKKQNVTNVVFVSISDNIKIKGKDVDIINPDEDDVKPVENFEEPVERIADEDDVKPVEDFEEPVERIADEDDVKPVEDFEEPDNSFEEYIENSSDETETE